jgi:outer membrane biosynthesis protein TonB
MKVKVDVPAFGPKDFIKPEDRRRDSLYSRIDNFIAELRDDSRVEIKVPATQGRKAYSYFREGGKAKGAAIIGGLALAGLGAAAIGAGLRGRSQSSTGEPGTKFGREADYKKAAIATGATLVAGAGVATVKAQGDRKKRQADEAAVKAQEEIKVKETQKQKEEEDKVSAEKERQKKQKLEEDIKREEARRAESKRMMDEVEEKIKAEAEAREKEEAQKNASESEKALAVLGLGKDATSEEAKKAYRSLSLKYHPDVNKEEGATMKSSELNKAKETLRKFKRMNSLHTRIDAFAEQLREDAKCGSGSKSCGKVCIPQEKNCLGETAKAFGGGALQSLAGPIGSGTYRALRKRGHGRGMSIGGAIAANVGAALTPAAGALALGAMAAKKAEDEQKKGKK